MARAVRIRIDKPPAPWMGRLHVFLARRAPGLMRAVTRLNRRTPQRLRARLRAQVALTNLELFARGDPAGLEIYHPDIEFVGMQQWTQFGLPERAVGRAALLEYSRKWAEIFDSVEYRQVELIDIGDVLVGKWLMTGTVRGLTTRLEAGQLIRLAPDGRVIHQQDFGSWAEAVAAAGLPPEVAR